MGTKERINDRRENVAARGNPIDALTDAECSVVFDYVEELLASRKAEWLDVD